MTFRSRAAAALTLTLALSGCTAPAPTGRPGRVVLPFAEDDYSRALSEARARKIPIFVECWTPW